MMTQQVEHLVQFLCSLPEAEQDRIARSLLEEAKWEASLQTPKGKAFVDNLKAEVESEIQAGTTITMDEFLQKAEVYNREHP